jgi:hypothetical protein
VIEATGGLAELVAAVGGIEGFLREVDFDTCLEAVGIAPLVGVCENEADFAAIVAAAGGVAGLVEKVGLETVMAATKECAGKRGMPNKVTADKSNKSVKAVKAVKADKENAGTNQNTNVDTKKGASKQEKRLSTKKRLSKLGKSLRKGGKKSSKKEQQKHDLVLKLALEQAAVADEEVRQWQAAKENKTAAAAAARESSPSRPSVTDFFKIEQPGSTEKTASRVAASAASTAAAGAVHAVHAAEPVKGSPVKVSSVKTSPAKAPLVNASPSPARVTGATRAAGTECVKVEVFTEALSFGFKEGPLGFGLATNTRRDQHFVLSLNNGQATRLGVEIGDVVTGINGSPLPAGLDSEQLSTSICTATRPLTIQVARRKEQAVRAAVVGGGESGKELDWKNLVPATTALDQEGYVLGAVGKQQQKQQTKKGRWWRRQREEQDHQHMG